MPLGSSAPSGHLGSRDGLLEEYYGLDPTIAPGLQRPIGWRVIKPDGTGAWDKTGAGATQWTVVGAGGGGSGVTSFNGLTGAVTGVGTFNGSAGPAILYKPIDAVATVAALAALTSTPAAGYATGDLIWAADVGDFFRLRVSALATDPYTVIAATGVAGSQWVRLGVPNPNWAAQTTWFVDPQNGTALASDSNSGIDATHPLRTWKELARRLVRAVLPANVAVTQMSTGVSTDIAQFSFTALANVNFTITVTPTVLFTGAVTTYTAATAAPATDDFEMSDTSIPVSFTASGLLADAVLFKRTNSTAQTWFAAKDLGSKTIRITEPGIGVASGATKGTLAPGDTYTASSLGQLFELRFAAGLRPQTVVINTADVRWSAILAGRPDYISWINCWFSVASAFGSGSYAICGVSVAQFFRANVGFYDTVFSGGLFRGTGVTSAMQLAQGPTFKFGSSTSSPRITFQGAACIITGSNVLVNADIAIYDCTGVGLQALYWSTVLFFNGAIAGSGNTGATFIQVNRWSQLAYIAAALLVAGSSSSATPVRVGGLDVAVAALPVGVTYTGASEGCGVYQTT